MKGIPKVRKRATLYSLIQESIKLDSGEEKQDDDHYEIKDVLILIQIEHRNNRHLEKLHGINFLKEITQ
jgi:hypothetical protein